MSRFTLAFAHIPGNAINSLNHMDILTRNAFLLIMANIALIILKLSDILRWGGGG
jgi:hypothetical protein